MQVFQATSSVNNHHACLLRLGISYSWKEEVIETRRLFGYNRKICTATLVSLTQWRDIAVGWLQTHLQWELWVTACSLFISWLFIHPTWPDSQLLSVHVFSHPSISPFLSPLPKPSQGSQTLSLITSFPVLRGSRCTNCTFQNYWGKSFCTISSKKP